MKRIVLPLCGLLAALSLPALAREVTGAEAAAAATRWLQLHPRPLASQIAPGAVKETRTVKDAAGTALFHVVRLEEGGVVVTSAETGVTPVIAFLDADDVVESDENPLWRILNADLARRNAAVAELRARPAPMAAGAADPVLAAAENDLAETEGAWDALLAVGAANGTEIESVASLSSVSDVRVAPLVQSTWDQDYWNGEYTFNYYTPSHYYSGCVATAGAQVMRYWCFPVNSVAAASVACFVDGSETTLKMKGGVYDWANMPLRESDCTTGTQREAIGRLLYDLGVATHMSYGSGGSGAFGTDMAAALRENFGYKSAKAVWLEGGDGITENIENHAAARNAILASLDANMPVTLSVYGNGGHHIVGDGYGYSGGTLYTHINMGWNGSQNAWYALSSERMTGYNFTTLSEVIYNIHPAFGPGDVISGRVTDSSGNPISGATVTLSFPGMTTLTAKTCPTGVYAFMVGQAGTYTIKAQCESASDSRKVTISKLGTTAEMRSRSARGGSIKTFGSVGNVWGVDFSLDVSAPSLEAPTGVSATDGTSAASIAVTWNAVDGATSYAVYRGSTSQASELVAENISGTQYSDTSATPGVRWYYRVRAFNASGSSDYSDPDDGWRLLSAPATFDASDGNSAAVELSWSASEGATSYTVFRGEAPNPTDVLASGVPGTSYSDLSAAVGTTYHYRVKAVSSLCESGYSPDDTGYRTAPLNVNLQASDGTEADHVAISWSDVPGATSYTLYRGSTATASDVLQSGIVSTSFSDATANPGVRYYYRLKAATADGESPFSNSDAGWRALAAPIGLDASKGTSPDVVELSWTATPGASTYTLYRGTSDNPTSVLRTGLTGTSYSDATAVAGTRYYYRLKAVCALGASAFSESAWGYRRTAMSSVLTATDGVFAEAVHVSWTPVSGASSYFLYRSATAGDPDPVLLEGGLSPETTSYDDINAMPGKKYWYKIQAKFGSEYSGFSNEDSGFRILLPPDNLTASDGTSTSSVTIKWSKAVGATSYLVYRGYREGKDWSFSVLDRNVTEESYTDTTASPGIVCNYYVVAACTLDDRTYRSDVSEDDTGYRKLSAPTLEATPSPSKVGLSWTAVAGPETLTYTVYRGTAANSVKTQLAAGLSGTTFDDDSAVPEQHYFYKVVAVNGSQKSDDSNIAEGWRTPGFFTTMDASDGTSTEKVDVSWTAVEYAVSYDLYRHTRTAAGVLSGETKIAENLTATAFVDDTATPGVLYWYRIKANYVGESSDFCKADSGFRKISPPTGLEATQGTLTTGVTLTWETNPDGASSYIVYRGDSASSVEQIATTTTSKKTYSDTAAPPGVLLWYRIAAVGGVSTSEWTVAVSGHRKLAAPSGNLVASDGTSDEFVALSWNTVDGATSYNVYRGGESETVPTNLLCNTGSAEGVWNDATAEAGEYYWYRVTAVCDLSESDFGKADRGYKSLPAPKNLKATDGGEEIEGEWERYFDGIVVSWDAVEGASSYTLFRGTSDNPTTAWTNNLEGTTFTDVWANTARTTPITPGTRYWYAVKANYANGTSSTYSNTDSGFIALMAPTNFVAADGASTANVALSWNAVNGAKSYLVARDTDPVAATNNPTLIKIGQTSASYNDTTATNGVLYHYYVAAVSTGVCTSEWSLVDSGFRMLETPRNVLATDGTSTESVTVSWNPVTGAERYLLFRGEAEAAIDTTAPFREFPADQTEFVDVDTDSSVVEPGKPYWYQVAAASSICTGALSTAESGFRAIPGPIGLRATDGAFTDKIEIVWSSVTNASSYSLYRGTSSNKVTTLVATTGANVTNYVDLVDSSIPKPGQIYWYQVRATSTSQTPGAWSEPESGYMTLAAPILSAGQGASTASVGLSWPAVTGASGYNLYRCEVPGHDLDAEVTDDLLAGIVTNRSEHLVKKVTGTSFADSGATNGVLYAYVLEAYSSAAITGACSAVVAGWRKVAAPTKIAATDGTSPDNVAITWTGSAGALRYVVLRGDSASTVTNVLAETMETRYEDTGAKHGKVYWYAVRAVGKDFTSDSGTPDSGYRKFPAPAVTVSDGAWTDRIEVSWEDADYAAYYIVYRGTSDNPTQQIQYELHGTNFVDTSVTPGTVYYYRLKAVSKDDGATVSEYGASDSGYRRLEAPLAPTVAVSGTSLKVTWTKVLGGTHYRAYRATSPDAPDDEKVPLGNWTTSTSFTDSTCTGGKTYWYFIQAAVNTSGDRPSDIGPGSAGTPPPGNDAFEKAYVLSGRSGTTEGGNRGATLQDYEPRHAGASVVAASVWWKWTPTENGTNVLDTVGSAFDTILAVYTGSSIESLTAIASDGSEGTGGVVFEATAGTTYYIAVASRSGSEADTGAIVLNWRDQSDAAGPDPVDPGDSLTAEDLADGHLPVEVTADGFTVKFRSRQGGVTYQLVAAGSCDLTEDQWNGVAVGGNAEPAGEPFTSAADTSETKTELVTLTAPMDVSARFFKIRASR